MSGELRLHIWDDNKNWVDFTDRFHKNRNGLESVGTIKRKLMDEIINSTFSTSLTSIKMNNSDYFWDNINKWEDLKTVNGQSANFSLSKNYYEVDLKGNWIKLSEYFENKYIVLGFFQIKKFSTFLNKGIASIKLKSISQYLKEKSAENVKNGKGWYINYSVTFLLKELLNSLDDELFNYDLPDRLKIPTINGKRMFSQLGMPPSEVRNNIYNPLVYYQFSVQFSDQFLNVNLDGKLG